MLIALAIVMGFLVLIWSADLFVTGAAAIAQNLGVSRALVGLTIVSIGTSSPEILVSISATATGAGQLAVGNAIGSNIANIGLVLGVTLFFCAIKVENSYMDFEIPILIAITLLTGLMVIDRELSRINSLIMILTLFFALSLIIKKQLHHVSDELDLQAADIRRFSNLRGAVYFSVGLGLLIVSSRILVWGATNAAIVLGVSELIIGLTIVAVGTSLPELAASIASAVKGHADLAFGNVIGSNVFNLLAVMPIPGLINSIDLAKAFLYRDFSTMVFLTAILAVCIYVMRFRFFPGNTGVLLGRKMGALLVTTYVLYYYWLYSSMWTG